MGLVPAKFCPDVQNHLAKKSSTGSAMCMQDHGPSNYIGRGDTHTHFA